MRQNYEQERDQYYACKVHAGRPHLQVRVYFVSIIIVSSNQYLLQVLYDQRV